MQIIDALRKKKVKVVEVPKWGGYLRQQWEDSFVGHMSLLEKKEIFMYDEDGACGYLWHVFSYEKRECLKGQQADQAFNAVRKKDCYVFYQHSDDVLILEEAAALEADDLFAESDVYVTDRELTWTYVKTHETGWCGPYFSQI